MNNGNMEVEVGVRVGGGQTHCYIWGLKAVIRLLPLVCVSDVVVYILDI